MATSSPSRSGRFYRMNRTAYPRCNGISPHGLPTHPEAGRHSPPCIQARSRGKARKEREAARVRELRKVKTAAAFHVQAKHSRAEARTRKAGSLTGVPGSEADKQEAGERSCFLMLPGLPGPWRRFLEPTRLRIERWAKRKQTRVDGMSLPYQVDVIKEKKRRKGKKPVFIQLVETTK